MSELSIKQSNSYVKELLKKPKNIRKEDMYPGRLLFYKYDQKDKEQIYDRTPLVLVLRVSRGYMLGLNLHWLPYQKRIWLVDQMLKKSNRDIKNSNRINFTYQDFKPLMKSVHYQPCIRLYIRKRISPKGVVIPPSELKNAQRLRAESFTGGKYNSQQLYRQARSKMKRRRR